MAPSRKKTSIITSGSTVAWLRNATTLRPEQLGHTDPRFTLAVYTKAVKRRAKLSGAYLAEYERALAWAALPTAEKAPMGTSARSEAPEFIERPA